MSATTGINSSLSNASALALFQSQTQHNSLAEMLSTSTTGTSSDSSDLESLLKAGLMDTVNISVVSAMLSAVGKAASESGSSKAMEGVTAFVKSLQNQGTDTVSILQYLEKAREMAKSDPEQFVELFTASDDAAATESTGA